MLWNSEQYLTEEGLNLIKVGDVHGGESQEFKNYLGSLILDMGRHYELINDVKCAIADSEIPLNDINDVRLAAYNYLEKKGYVKLNPNRTTSGVRKFLASEFQVWGHLGILNKQNNTYFDVSNGLSFNEERINELTNIERLPVSLQQEV